MKKLVDSASKEGPGQKYLIQHSAGSGKSNSIAWLAHQLTGLTIHEGQDQGKRVFRNVIVITDRTVLDSQLQDTIFQFDHQAGVVNRISREEGGGSKSQKLTSALLGDSPIIIVTIQTFPHIIEAIREETSLKDFTFAIIADEAHSSQTGKTASQLRSLLRVEISDEEEITAEDILRWSLEGKKSSKNVSYFAFTATPKSATLQTFGRLKYPDKPKSDGIEKMYSFGDSLIPEIMKNEDVVNQMKAGNTKEQIMQGDFKRVLIDAIMNTLATNQDISAKLLSNETHTNQFEKFMLNLCINGLGLK